MLALALTTIFMAGFGLVVRAAQRRKLQLLTVALLNYLTATIFYASWCLAAGVTTCRPQTAIIGIIGGIAYGGGFFLLMASLHWRGAGIVTAINGLSVLVPMGVSYFLWRETLTPVQTAGVALALSALPLLGLDQGGVGGRLTPRMALVMGGLFLINGGCLLSQKWYHIVGQVAERPAFLCYLFATAAVILAVACLQTKSRTGPGEVGFGVLLGTCNLLASLMLLYSLDRLPGVVVFPVMQSGMMIVAAVFSSVVWREMPGRLGIVGIAIAVVAVVLINLSAGTGG